MEGSNDLYGNRVGADSSLNLGQVTLRQSISIEKHVLGVCYVIGGGSIDVGEQSDNLLRLHKAILDFLVCSRRVGRHIMISKYNCRGVNLRHSLGIALGGGVNGCCGKVLGNLGKRLLKSGRLQGVGINLRLNLGNLGGEGLHIACVPRSFRGGDNGKYYANEKKHRKAEG